MTYSQLEDLKKQYIQALIQLESTQEKNKENDFKNWLNDLKVEDKNGPKNENDKELTHKDLVSEINELWYTIKQLRDEIKQLRLVISQNSFNYFTPNATF